MLLPSSRCEKAGPGAEVWLSGPGGWTSCKEQDLYEKAVGSPLVTSLSIVGGNWAPFPRSLEGGRVADMERTGNATVGKSAALERRGASEEAASYSFGARCCYHKELGQNPASPLP